MQKTNLKTILVVVWIALVALTQGQSINCSAD